MLGPGFCVDNTTSAARPARFGGMAEWTRAGALAREADPQGDKEEVGGEGGDVGFFKVDRYLRHGPQQASCTQAGRHLLYIQQVGEEGMTDFFTAVLLYYLLNLSNLL